jgi:hypothetical protein
MFYSVLADLIVALHLTFVVFSVIGGLCVFKWRRIAWVHVPAVTWAVINEFTGWVCPLTPVEDWLRAKGGATEYKSGLVEHYILPLIYPSALTRRLQIFLGIIVLGVNAIIYVWIVCRLRKNKV